MSSPTCQSRCMWASETCGVVVVVMLAMHVAGKACVIDDVVVVVTSVPMSLVLWWRRISRIILRVQSLCASAVTSANLVAAGVRSVPLSWRTCIVMCEHVGEPYAVVSILCEPIGMHEHVIFRMIIFHMR